MLTIDADDSDDDDTDDEADMQAGRQAGRETGKKTDKQTSEEKMTKTAMTMSPQNHPCMSPSAPSPCMSPLSPATSHPVVFCLKASRQYSAVLIPNIIVHDVSACASLQPLGFLNFPPECFEMSFAF